MHVNTNLQDRKRERETVGKQSVVFFLSFTSSHSLCGRDEEEMIIMMTYLLLT
jgi:hypothetical protein